MKNALIIISSFLLISCDLLGNREAKKNKADLFQFIDDDRKLKSKCVYVSKYESEKFQTILKSYEFSDQNLDRNLIDSVLIINKTSLNHFIFDIYYDSIFTSSNTSPHIKDIKEVDGNNLLIIFNDPSQDSSYIKIFQKDNKLYINRLFYKNHYLNLTETENWMDTLIEVRNRIDFYSLSEYPNWKSKTIISDSIAYQNSLAK